jgi:hypothetical protein
VRDQAQVTRRAEAGAGAGYWRSGWAAAAVIVGGVIGIELFSYGVLPYKTMLDRIDGACSVRPTLLARSAELRFRCPGAVLCSCLISLSGYRLMACARARR